MHGQANVGQSVLNLGAFVEAEPANQFVANAAAAESFFERARLEIGAIFDSAGLAGIVFKQFLQFLGDKFGFGLGIARFEVAKIGAGGLFRAQSFAETIGIIFDYAPGGVEDALRGTVIAFQANHSGVGKI